MRSWAEPATTPTRSPFSFSASGSVSDLAFGVMKRAGNCRYGRENAYFARFSVGDGDAGDDRLAFLLLQRVLAARPMAAPGSGICRRFRVRRRSRGPGRRGSRSAGPTSRKLNGGKSTVVRNRMRGSAESRAWAAAPWCPRIWGLRLRPPGAAARRAAAASQICIARRLQMQTQMARANFAPGRPSEKFFTKTTLEKALLL